MPEGPTLFCQFRWHQRRLPQAPMLMTTNSERRNQESSLPSGLKLRVKGAWPHCDFVKQMRKCRQRQQGKKTGGALTYQRHSPHFDPPIPG